MLSNVDLWRILTDPKEGQVVEMSETEFRDTIVWIANFLFFERKAGVAINEIATCWFNGRGPLIGGGKR